MKKDIDFFSHNVIAKKIASLFSEESTSGSFVIAINGAWGTGKTHLMTKVLDELEDSTYIKVNFNAWRYAEKEDIRRALLICIIDECRQFIERESTRTYLQWDDSVIRIIEGLFDDTERSLYTAFEKEIPGEISIDTSNLVKTGINLALKFVPWGNFGNDLVQKLLVPRNDNGYEEKGYIEQEDIEKLWGIFTRSSTKRNIEKIIGVEQFRKTLEILLKAILEGRYEGDSKSKKICGHDKKIKLVVAIDDLDRCLPEDALIVLEAIKLFIDYSNTYFMIAMDGNIIENGLNMRYNKFDSVMIRAKDYYEKMIDLSFNIPALIKENFYLYIQSLTKNGREYIKLFDLLFIALNTNLRAWQRYVHRTDFNKALIEEIAGKDVFNNEKRLQIYLKLQCLSYQWPEVYRTICDMETYILLEQKLGLISNYERKELEEILKDLMQLSVDKNIINIINDKNITDFILKEPTLDIQDEALNVLFTFDKSI